MIDWTYKRFCGNVLSDMEIKQTRNGTTYSSFGKSLSFDLEQTGFPLISLRKIYPKGIIGEFKGFLNDAKTVAEFKEYGCNYWDLWGDKDGNLVLDYPPREQLTKVIKSIKEDPNGRRHLIDLWNHENLDKLSLPCCHYAYQFYVRGNKYLDLVWTQRSIDIAIGLPSDFVLSALYLAEIGNATGYTPGRVTMNFGDAHIYEDHYHDLLNILHNRNCNSDKIIWNWDGDKATYKDYNPYPPVKFNLIK